MKTLSLLIKPTSGSCNMRCSYCFYTDVKQSREMEDRGFMTLNTLEAIVENAFLETEQFVSFGFQGGEPTIRGLDFYKEFISLTKKYNKNNLPVAFSIQTNGMLIDSAWAEFFAEHDFLVGLSVDGSRDIHDKLRLDSGGKETHTRCIKAANTLKKAGAEFSILSVITKEFARHPDKTYQFYKANDFRYIQLIPCLDRLNEAHGTNPYSLGPELYGKFLCQFFDLWYQDFIQGDYFSVRMFDNLVRILMGQPPENCGMLGRCEAYPVIEADGSVYPCDFYVIDRYNLGSVYENTFTEMLLGKTTAAFTKPSKEVDGECISCQFIGICRGGCRRDREPSVDGALSLNYYCPGYKVFFDHTLPRLINIAQKMPR